MSDEWLKERATDLADTAVGERHNVGMYAYVAEAAETALREAEDRILARLREPDEAMVEAVALANNDYVDWRVQGIDICRALADHLDKRGGE